MALLAHTMIGSANGTTTSAIDTTGAKFIILQMTWGQSVPGGTPTDNKGNTWTPLTQHPSGSMGSQLFYCIAPTVGTGHTFAYVETAQFGSLGVQAFDDNVVAFDQEGPASASGATVTSSSITPAGTGYLVICGATPFNVSLTTINSPWNISDTIPLTGGVNFAAGMAWQLQTTATATSMIWQMPGGGVGAGSIASFQVVSSVTIEPPAGALALATFAPTVDLSAGITPPAGALTLATFAPLLDRTIPVPAGALTLATFAPMLGIVVGPVPTAALVLATFPPKLTFSFGPAAGNHAAAWWWTGAAARMINDAGFQLLVEPHLQDEGYTGEPQPIEGAE